MPRPSTPVSPGENSQLGAGCVRLFFLPFFAAGCFFFYLILIQPLWNIWQARDWREVPCRILSSEVKRSTGGSDGVSYKILIRYAYQVNGRAYESDRYDFTGMSSGGYSGKRNVVDRYPPGALEKCFVNPEQPSEAVLYRGMTKALWWGLFPLPFIAVGLLAFAPARVFANATSRTGPLKSTGASKLPIRPAASAHLHGTLSGPTELRASSSRVGKLIFLIFFALFWNGIVSIFVRQVWEGISRGRPEWFLTIFLIPFVLVGLGCILAVVYTFLDLFNPRITLLVSSATVPLGGSVGVQWSFRGNVRRIRSLSITLEGVERATYRRGTDTTTDRHVFTKIPVVETADPAVISAGSGQIAVPGHLMHSFKAPNNEIAWSFKVKGSIPRFPDIGEEFPLTVLPHAQPPL